MTWITRLQLRQRDRNIPLDNAFTHRLLTKATNTNTYLWASPRPGMLIVQSENPLDAATTNNIATSVYASPRETHFEAGTRLQYAGILSPAKTERIPGKRGKKHMMPFEECAPWFTRQIIEAATAQYVEVKQMAPAKGTSTQGHRIFINRVSFTGQLTVTNPDRFHELLTRGIGRGKRFGAGLLLTEVMA